MSPQAGAPTCCNYGDLCPVLNSPALLYGALLLSPGLQRVVLAHGTGMHESLRRTLFAADDSADSSHNGNSKRCTANESTDASTLIRTHNMGAHVRAGSDVLLTAVTSVADCAGIAMPDACPSESSSPWAHSTELWWAITHMPVSWCTRGWHPIPYTHAVHHADSLFMCAAIL